MQCTGYSLHGITVFLAIRISLPLKHHLPAIPENKGVEKLYLNPTASFQVVLVSLAAYDKKAYEFLMGPGTPWFAPSTYRDSIPQAIWSGG